MKASSTMNQSTRIGADGLVATTPIVTGASRALRRATAAAVSEAGFTPVVADAADPSTARRLIDEHRPRTLVLCAGATPRMSPLQNQTWESFSENWNMDVAQAFHWIGHALR